MSNLMMPPNSKEAEQAVLSTLLQTPKELILKESDFYHNDHKLIYKAIQHLAEKNKPHDAMTVSDTMESAGTLDLIGGLSYLTDLVNTSAAFSNYEAYANIVKERATLRNIIAASNYVADLAYNPDGMNADSILEKAYDSLGIINTQTDTDIPSIEDTTFSAINQLEHRYNNKGELTGVSSSFTEFDNETLGYQKGELYLIGGRPAMGKSTWALNSAIKAAISGKHVLFFSLEMPKERLIDKCVSDLASINMQKIKSGQLDDEEWGRAANAISLIKDSSLRIDDRAGQTMQTITMKCKKLHAKRKLDLIVVDYLQLIRVDGVSRLEEVSEVSRSLKELAKNLEVPVVALCQLNRGLENRSDKRPRTSDLRESGQLEQDADLIAFLYRDEVYYEDCAGNKGIAEFIITKNRFGEIGKHLLASELWFSRFRDCELTNYQPYKAEKQTGGFEG